VKKLLILAALIAAPVPAFADPAQTTKIQISSAGLDLADPADAAAMIRRIEAAVRPMCVAPGFANGRSTAGCVNEATRKAVKNLRVPELDTALARRSTPVSQG
jgi:UrcA family protein